MHIKQYKCEKCGEKLSNYFNGNSIIDSNKYLICKKCSHKMIINIHTNQYYDFIEKKFKDLLI